jgi:predicted peptidase
MKSLRNLSTPDLQPERTEIRLTFGFRYLLSRPIGYRKTGRRKWPLLVFFHGRGERGTDLDLLKRHGPPRLLAAGKTLPFVVVAPQCTEDDYWWNYPALDALVDAMIKRYRIDAARVYLTGISMGGFATWALAQYNPGRYAAIAPICGGGDVRLAANLRELPIWAFHGTKDDIIPVTRTTEMITAIRAAGGSPKVTLYRGVNHDSWTRTYENRELYTWLLSHRRRRRAFKK